MAQGTIVDKPRLCLHFPQRRALHEQLDEYGIPWHFIPNILAKACGPAFFVVYPYQDNGAANRVSMGPATSSKTLPTRRSRPCTCPYGHPWVCGWYLYLVFIQMCKITSIWMIKWCTFWLLWRYVVHRHGSYPRQHICVIACGKSIRYGVPYLPQQDSMHVPIWKYTPLILTIFTSIIAGGIGSEFIQSLLPVCLWSADPQYKTFQLGDILANLMGSCTGLYAAYYMEQRYRARCELQQLYAPLDLENVSEPEDDAERDPIALVSPFRIGESTWDKWDIE